MAARWEQGLLLLVLLALFTPLAIRADHSPSNLHELANGDTVSCIRLQDQPSLAGRKELYNKKTLPEIPTQPAHEGEEKKSDSEIHLPFINPCNADVIPVLYQKNAPTDAFMKQHFSGRGKALSRLAASQGEPTYEHAVAQLKGQTRGVRAGINLWSPAVEQKAEYSLAMVRVIAGISGKENVIEAGVHVFPQMYGDSKLRYFISWTADGYQNTGCYNLACEGFVQTGGSVTLGSIVSPVSQRNSSQFDLKTLIFQDKQYGNWFLHWGNETIGHWPASLFNAFSQGASISQWGGEIANLRTRSKHTATDMGSGEFASQGFGHAAFMRDLRFVDEENILQFAENAQTDSDNANCYSVSQLFSGEDPWNIYLFYGGPGLNAACH